MLTLLTWCMENPSDGQLRAGMLKFETRGFLLSLLPPADQERLLDRYGFDPRRHAVGPAWVVLLFCVFGVFTSISSLGEGVSVAPVLSILAALFLGIEQIRRLVVLREGRPAGSVLGPLVRPFVRHLLERG